MVWDKICMFLTYFKLGHRLTYVSFVHNMQVKITHCWLFVSHETQRALYPDYLPTNTLSLFIVFYLFSSFTLVISATATLGCHLTVNFSMGRTKLLVQANYLWGRTVSTVYKGKVTTVMSSELISAVASPVGYCPLFRWSPVSPKSIPLDKSPFLRQLIMIKMNRVHIFSWTNFKTNFKFHDFKGPTIKFPFMKSPCFTKLWYFLTHIHAAESHFS